MEAPYTRLYVDGPIGLHVLLERVATTVRGSIDHETVVADDVEVDVRSNEYFDRHSVDRDPTDFIHYAYSVEVEGKKLATLSRYLEVVSQIMRAIHHLGANVVASCDWEDDLPGGGRLGAVFAQNGTRSQGR